MHAFFKGNTFISNVGLKLAKIKQKLSNTQRLDFLYLKIIHFFNQPKIIGDILKNVQKTSASVLMTLYD